MNLTKPNLKDDKRIFNEDFQVLPYLMKQRFLCETWQKWDDWLKIYSRKNVKIYRE